MDVAMQSESIAMETSNYASNPSKGLSQSLQDELLNYAMSYDDIAGSPSCKNPHVIDDPTEECSDSSYCELDEGEELCKRLYGDDDSILSEDSSDDFDDDDSFCYDSFITQQKSDYSLGQNTYFQLPTEGIFCVPQGASLRKVRFSDVHVREYAVTVGDHPCTTDMCPLTLDWEHTETTRQNIVEYEYSRLISGKCFRRLSQEQRRLRIQIVKDVDEITVRTMETDLAMTRLAEVKKEIADIAEMEREVVRQQALPIVSDHWMPVPAACSTGTSTSQLTNTGVPAAA